MGVYLPQKEQSIQLFDLVNDSVDFKTVQLILRQTQLKNKNKIYL